MGKRIFMLVNYTPHDNSIGITKKIRAEINSMRKLGYYVTYTAYVEGGVCIFDNNDKEVHIEEFFIKNDMYQKFMRHHLLIKTAKRFLESSNSYEICYMRMTAPDRRLLSLLSFMKAKGICIVAESLSYFPKMKFKSLKGKYIIAMFKLNGRYLKKYIEFFLTEGNYDKLFGVRTRPMKLGVDTEQIKKHIYIGDKNELNMISVANETMYHGYDRIIKSIGNYYKERNGKINIKLHLVGVMSKDTKNLVSELGLDKVVKLYGKRSGAELDAIYGNCNIGVGPLAQHRMGGKKDTGLKTKEYFAKGLPYIYSGEEELLPDDYPYVLEVPSDESIIKLEEVWEFYERIKDDEFLVDNMRRFAFENYSWDAIMANALEGLS